VLSRRLLQASSVAAVAFAAMAWRGAVDLSVPPPEAVLGMFTDAGFLSAVSRSYLALWLVLLGWVGLGRVGLMRATAAHGGLLVVLWLVELASVVGWVDYQELALRDRAHQIEAVRRWSEPDQHISGETLPDLAELMRVHHPLIPFELRTDRFGLRNPPGVDDPRVLCLGDSILVAGLVEESSLATVRLSGALGVDVMNISQLGYAPQESLARLDSLDIGVNGRVVLHVVYEANDLSDSRRWRQAHAADPVRPWRGVAHPTEPRQWPESGLRAALLRWLRSPTRGMAARRSASWGGGAAPKTVYFLYDASWVQRDLDELVPLGALMASAAEVIEAEGGAYAAIYVPSKLTTLHPFVDFPPETELAPRLRDSGMAEAFRETCAAWGLTCLDTTEALRAQARAGALPYLPLDTHLSAAGHAALAEATEPLARQLLAELDAGD
jgi:hypothetical protein